MTMCMIGSNDFESTQIKVAQILVHIRVDVQLSVCH